MMTELEILARIQNWESQITEFKREFTSDPIRSTLVAFANDYRELGGGAIIIGVDPDSHALLDLPANMDELLERVAGLCRDGSIVPTLAPSIYSVVVNQKPLLVIEIEKSGRRPHRANNICYIRIGPTTRKATPDEEFELLRKSGRFPFDLMPVREARVEDLNLARFELEFLPKRLSSDTLATATRSPLEWAENLRFLFREGTHLVPTVASVLLFAKRPQDFLPQSSIDFIQFEGDDLSSPIQTRKLIGGTIDEMITTGVDLVRRYMVQGYQFSQTTPLRQDVFEYPLRAVREAVVNAILHRDYEIARASVTIRMFDDRLEILSPGGLYGIVTRENFGTGVNDYRNPTLAVSLNLLGFAEKAGTGIFTIRRQMKENGSLEPSFNIGDSFLLVTMPSNPSYLGARLFQKGLVSLEKGDREEARNLFKRSAQLVPHFPEVWAGLGRLAGLYGDLDEARKAFQKAISENPSFEKAYLEWGKIEDQAGEAARAREIFRQGTQALPGSADLWYAWAMLEQKTALRGARGQGTEQKWRIVSALLAKAVESRPNDTRLLRVAANTASRLRDWDKVTDYLHRALATASSGDQQKGAIFFELMKALLEAGAGRNEVAEIKECFESAYALGFRSHEFFHRYHQYLTANGFHAEALDVLERARKEGEDIAPALPEVYVGGLPVDIPRKKMAKELEKLFRQKGLSVSKIIINPNRSFGFATLASENDARVAITELDGTEILGTRIVVKRKRKGRTHTMARTRVEPRR